jgi:hypothetical protein
VKKRRAAACTLAARDRALGRSLPGVAGHSNLYKA